MPKKWLEVVDKQVTEVVAKATPRPMELSVVEQDAERRHWRKEIKKEKEETEKVPDDLTVHENGQHYENAEEKQT